jgi:acetyltransferase
MKLQVIQEWSPSQQNDLIALLQDAVASGASVGFLPPLSLAEAQEYWEGVRLELEQRTKILLVAMDNKQIVGTVQLGFCTKANGRHRAEVQKLLVHRTHRRKGIGRQLMAMIEKLARENDVVLLYLDTEPDQPAEKMYQELGWEEAGRIPDYFTKTDGELYTTVIYYKRIN